jgi:hypothetical protein
MNTKTSAEYNNKNKTLIVFAVIAALGLVMATVGVLPIVPQAHAVKPSQPPACLKHIDKKGCIENW